MWKAGWKVRLGEGRMMGADMADAALEETTDAGTRGSPACLLFFRDWGPAVAWLKDGQRAGISRSTNGGQPFSSR